MTLKFRIKSKAIKAVLFFSMSLSSISVNAVPPILLPEFEGSRHQKVEMIQSAALHPSILVVERECMWGEGSSSHRDSDITSERIKEFMKFSGMMEKKQENFDILQNTAHYVDCLASLGETLFQEEGDPDRSTFLALVGGGALLGRGAAYDSIFSIEHLKKHPEYIRSIEQILQVNSGEEAEEKLREISTWMRSFSKFINNQVLKEISLGFQHDGFVESSLKSVTEFDTQESQPIINIRTLSSLPKGASLEMVNPQLMLARTQQDDPVRLNALYRQTREYSESLSILKNVKKYIEEIVLYLCRNGAFS